MIGLGGRKVLNVCSKWLAVTNDGLKNGLCGKLLGQGWCNEFIEIGFYKCDNFENSFDHSFFN